MNNGLCLKKRTLAYECACLEGYAGILCDQLFGQTCPSRPCEQGTCALDANSGKFGCVCKIGFGGNFCEIELCNPKCQNGGVCDKDVFGSYYCRCPPNYQGSGCVNLIQTQSKLPFLIYSNFSELVLEPVQYFNKTLRSKFSKNTRQKF